MGDKKVERYKELSAWQRSLRRIFIGRHLAARFPRGWGVGDQTRCAVLSVKSSPAYGFHRTSRNEFSLFLIFAKSSCARL